MAFGSGGGPQWEGDVDYDNYVTTRRCEVGRRVRTLDVAVLHPAQLIRTLLSASPVPPRWLVPHP